jgi:hypothetical protein
MPLQNRVDPFGDIHAVDARGLFTGNRGIIHDPATRTLLRRRWAAKAWIICSCEYKGVRREPMGRNGRNGRAGWTELFFLDEVTALAAGHRPCFECRRRDAVTFAQAWQQAFRLRAPPRAGEMDAALHCERLDGRTKRRHRRLIDDLPDGAVVALEQGAFAVRGNSLLPWTAAGYAARQRRPGSGTVDVLTPPSILAVLAAGYRPQWHPSAGASP